MSLLLFLFVILPPDMRSAQTPFGAWAYYEKNCKLLHSEENFYYVFSIRRYFE